MRRSLLTVLTVTAFAATACGYSDPYASSGQVANESPGPSASPVVSPGTDDFNAGAGLPVVTLPDGLKFIDLTVGTGDVAKTGENVTMQYTGWLSTGGTPFDTSRQPGRTAFTVQLGAGQVIPGWDEGIPGMKVGGKRKLTIPPELGYGTRGAGKVIPPNATLLFEVELLAVR